MGASVPLVRITCLKMSVMGFMPSEAAQQTRRRRACEAVPVWEGSEMVYLCGKGSEMKYLQLIIQCYMIPVSDHGVLHHTCL